MRPDIKETLQKVASIREDESSAYFFKYKKQNLQTKLNIIFYKSEIDTQWSDYIKKHSSLGPK